MRPWLLLLLSLLLWMQALWESRAEAATKKPLEVVIADPYIEMHSGPGRGFPVTYVVGRGDRVQVLFSRTDWFKVRAPRGEEGWVRRDEMVKTKLDNGDPAPIRGYPNFTTHTWEVGAGYGVFDQHNTVMAYLDYAITESLDAEIVLQQALGTIDNRYLALAGLRHTFIPEYKWISPTVGIGTGVQYTDKSTPPEPPEKTNQLAYVSFGLRGFITKRFMWRADWRRYVIFTKQNDNKEPKEWALALAVFF